MFGKLQVGAKDTFAIKQQLIKNKKQKQTKMKGGWELEKMALKRVSEFTIMSRQDLNICKVK